MTSIIQNSRGEDPASTSAGGLRPNSPSLASLAGSNRLLFMTCGFINVNLRTVGEQGKDPDHEKDKRAKHNKARCVFAVNNRQYNYPGRPAVSLIS